MDILTIVIELEIPNKINIHIIIILVVNKLVPNIKICQTKMNIIKNFPGVLEKLFTEIMIEPINEPIDVKEINRAKSLASPFRIFLLINGR